VGRHGHVMTLRCHELAKIVGGLRLQLLADFPDIPEPTIRDCAEEVLGDVLMDDSVPVDAAALLERIRERVRLEIH